MDKQLDIFSSSVLEKLRITKPIRLIELFAGYGSQNLALKYLGVDYESWRICEWNYKSFEAYKYLHFHKDMTDYSKNLTLDELREWAIMKGISADWNVPMPKASVLHLGEKEIREIYNCATAEHNIIDVSKADAESLGIESEELRKHSYIMTYSFPCQDLSLAGKRAGMDEDSKTRSSLLWQVGRILEELKKVERRPDILLMENVIQVHGKGNTENFNRWLNQLHDLGYTSYFKDLEATGFGIPQTRNRCFVVSVLGERSYEFPNEGKLKVRLKDLLEKETQAKYYLSRKQIDAIQKWDSFQKPLDNMKNMDKSNISYAITTRDGAFCASMKLVENDNPIVISTTTLNTCEGGGLCPIIIKKVSMPIKDCTKKGYDMASDGDGVYISNIDKKRGTVQKGKIQTLKTSPDVGVVVPKSKFTEEQASMIDEDGNIKRYAKNDARTEKFNPGECADISFPNGYNKGPRVHETCPALNTTTTESSFITKTDDLCIRKLTPREAFRLMGVKDDDFDRIKDFFPDSTLYHMAGDSIVVNVLMAIFKRML